MREVTAAAASALEQPERALFHRFGVDWDRDGYDSNLDDLSGRVGAAKADHALATDLPEQARVVPGAAAAQLVLELGAGNYGPRVEATYGSIASNSSGTALTDEITVSRPAGLLPGELVVAFIAYADETSWLTNPNAEWGKVSLQRDQTPGFAKIVEGTVLVRRATADEPDTYRWTSYAGAHRWVAYAVRIVGPGVAGVHAFSSRGAAHDSDTAAVHPALVTNRPARVTVPDCLGLTLFASHAGSSTSANWTPAAGATERGDLCTGGASSNVFAAVHTQPMAAVGTYEPQATASVTSETVIAITVVIAPALSGDDSQHAAWTFSELNAGSPYAGKQRYARPCRWDVGVATGDGVEYVPVFNGWTVSTEASSRSRTATVTAMDGRELLRKPIAPWIPLVLAEWPLPIISTETLPAWPGLESTWLVSHALLYALYGDDSGELQALGPGNGGRVFAAGPEPGPVCFLHVSCHGSLYPDTGGLYNAVVTWQDNTQHRCTFSAGPYVAATAPAPLGGSTQAKYSPNALSQPWDSNAQQNARLFGVFKVPRGSTASWGVTKDAFGSAIGAAGHMTIDTLGVVRLQLTRNTGTTRTVVGPTIPDDGAWHHVGVYWSSVAGSATFYLDGVRTAVIFSTWTNTALTSAVPFGYLMLTNGAQAAELQVDGGYNLLGTATNGQLDVSTPFPSEGWSPTAFVDKSDNVLEAVQPIAADLDVWGFLTQLAEAEYAAVYFDADMRPHFRTRRSDATDVGQTVVRTLRATDSLRDVDYVNGVAQVINTISVPYQTFSYVIAQKAFEPQGSVRLPAKQTVRMEWNFPGIPFSVSTLGFTHVGYNRKADGSGSSVSSSTIQWSTGWSRFLGHVELTNTNPYDVYAVTPSGGPGFYVTASWTVPEGDAPPVELSSGSSVQKYKAQAIGVPSSPWRQDHGSASSLCSMLLSNLKEPVPVLRNISIVGDPRLELGDLVRIVDAGGLAVDGLFRVTALQPSVDSTGTFVQQITARLAAAVAQWDTSQWGDGHLWGVEDG